MTTNNPTREKLASLLAQQLHNHVMAFPDGTLGDEVLYGAICVMKRSAELSIHGSVRMLLPAIERQANELVEKSYKEAGKR